MSVLPLEDSSWHRGFAAPIGDRMTGREMQGRTNPTHEQPRAVDADRAEVMELARDLIRAALSDPPVAGTAPPEVRATLERLCDAAHAQGLRAEQVLLRLKAAWRDLPELRRGLHDYDGLVLSRVVTLCIDEYFAPWRGMRD